MSPCPCGIYGGGHEAFSKAAFGAPFWEQALDQWEAMFDRGVRNHLLASRFAAPILIRQGRGLIVIPNPAVHCAPVGFYCSSPDATGVQPNR